MVLGALNQESYRIVSWMCPIPGYVPILSKSSIQSESISFLHVIFSPN